MHACRSRAAAAARCGRQTRDQCRIWRSPCARFCSGTAQVGTEQPSMAQTSCPKGGAGKVFQHGAHLPLHRMFGPEIIGRVGAHRASEAEEAGMLAGAIVVQRRGPTRTRQRISGGLRNRPMHAAAQRGSIEASLRQHALDAGDMRRLAAMRCAGERQLFVAEAITVGRPALDKRNRLQRLDRRARKDPRCDIANGQHAAAFGITHRHGAAVTALHQRPARHFDQDRIAHVRS